MTRFERLGGNKRAAEEKGNGGIHFQDLFDEDEDRSGEKIDLATGKRINNSRAVSGADETLSVVESNDPGSEDALGSVPNEDDEAARWLRNNSQSIH